MTASVYYNEIDPFAAQWMRNLINANHIAPGIVDERSIEDVRPDDLRGFAQCHFFAGIGVWSYALRRAGWADDRPIWTGSCPCQPFSQAGEGSGFDDKRHLWPHFHWLIQERRPAIVLGEQVASKDAEPWLDLVQLDLEGLGYAFGAVPFPSAGIGAPHIRDRLFWVAHADRSPGRKGRADFRGRADRGHAQPRAGSGGGGMSDWLADSNQHGRGAQPIAGIHDAQRDAEPCGSAGGMGHADSERTGRIGRGLCGQGTEVRDGQHSAHHADPSGADGGLGNAGHHHDASQGQAACAGQPQADRPADQPGRPGASLGAGTGPVNGFWRAADWLLCRDGRWRPVEPGTFPLVDGATSRVGRVRTDWHTPAGQGGQGHRGGRLKGYGNAINAEAARIFIEVVKDCIP